MGRFSPDGPLAGSEGRFDRPAVKQPPTKPPRTARATERPPPRLTSNDVRLGGNRPVAVAVAVGSSGEQRAQSVGHKRAGDGLVSALPASHRAPTRRVCATVGVVIEDALAQPPQPLCFVDQRPWISLPLSRAEACHSTAQQQSRSGGRLRATCKHTVAWQREQTWYLRVCSGEDHCGGRETRGGG